MRVTREWMREHDACCGDDQIDEYFGDRRYVLLSTVLRDEEIYTGDRLWIALRAMTWLQRGQLMHDAERRPGACVADLGQSIGMSLIGMAESSAVVESGALDGDLWWEIFEGERRWQLERAMEIVGVAKCS